MNGVSKSSSPSVQEFSLSWYSLGVLVEYRYSARNIVPGPIQRLKGRHCNLLCVHLCRHQYLCPCTVQNLAQPSHIDHSQCLDLWLGSLSIPCQPDPAKRSWQFWQSVGTHPSEHRSICCYSGQFCHARYVNVWSLLMYTHLVSMRTFVIVRELCVGSIGFGTSINGIFLGVKRVFPFPVQSSGTLQVLKIKPSSPPSAVSSIRYELAHSAYVILLDSSSSALRHRIIYVYHVRSISGQDESTRLSGRLNILNLNRFQSMIFCFWFGSAIYTRWFVLPK